MRQVCGGDLSNTLNRIENYDFSPRRFPQVIDKAIDLFGNLFFGQVTLDLVAHLLQGRHDAATVTLRAILLFVTVINFLRANQSKSPEPKIQISLDGDAVAEDRVQLLAGQTDAG